MDKRWQLVLGCLGEDRAPFSQGVLVSFRRRMVEHDLDRALLGRTVALARQTGKFGWQRLKVALDSSPLLGAGRVEDTWNLIGRAMGAVVTGLSSAMETPRQRIIDEVCLDTLRGSSVKASLDIDWDDPKQRHGALQQRVDEAERLNDWINDHLDEIQDRAPLYQAMEELQQILTQDLEPDPDQGGQRVRRGVAKDRMPSLGDKEMRHGRKSRSKKFNGYKRHVIRALDKPLLLDAMVMPANQPEHEAADFLLRTADQHGEIDEIAIDRGYLASAAVARRRQAGAAVRCKPWPSRNAGRYTKEDFDIDLVAKAVHCPAGQTASITPSGRCARFTKAACHACAQRPLCTRSKLGRSITIHPQEELLLDLRQMRRTSQGRQVLRQRVAVEHSLATIQQIQGRCARYVGTRKNTLDVRRCAAIANLQAISRMKRAA